MRARWRDRLAFWLERFWIVRPLLLRPLGRTGLASGLPLYENRLNGHIVTWQRHAR